MKRILVRSRTFFLSISFILSLSITFGQETNSHAFGIVKSERNEILQNASVIVVHEPTKNIYATQTNEKGYFYFFNIRPGGPYTITISYAGYELLRISNLFLSYTGSNFYSYLRDHEFIEYIMKEKNNTLNEIIVRPERLTQSKSGTETNIDNNKILSLPSISRNFQDYVRMVPQAKVNGDGMMSLAGQNNKYNTFFIDGSNNNDMLGLSSSGTSGGQTGSPPISMEAIDEIKVSLSPYDVQYNNFTGGAINAITKSGSNEFKSSAWYYFRNEKMAGRSPIKVEKTGSPGIYERTRLGSFFNQTAGVWSSGPVIKNKLFYFVLLEEQSEQQPQQYIFSEYKGTSSQQQIANLADTMRIRYNYEPGTFLTTKNELNATRFMVKLDWNPGIKNKLTLSYRYNGAERITPQMQNSGTVIRFSNNRFRLPSKTSSISLEYRKYFKSSLNNRLLITYNIENTDRKIIGQPFPVITISDGSAAITLGSNGSGQANIFTASEFSLLNILKYIRNRQVIGAGIDIDFSKMRDLALASYFGQYQYRNIDDFYSNAYPSRYFRNVSLIEEPVTDYKKAATHFNSLRTGAFISDEIQLTENLRLTTGVRMDANSLPLKYKEDIFFNSVARPAIEKYYNLEGAVAGRLMKPHWQLSPRFGFNYKTPNEKLTIRGGAGIFEGHILNVWASEIYDVNTLAINILPPVYGLHFNPDPFNQPGFHLLGLNPDNTKGEVSLVAGKYKYPTDFRTSVSADKIILNDWVLSTEIIFTKNIYENKYTNVNMLPPEGITPLPDSRNVYSVNRPIPERIPMPGGNPYSSIVLLENNNGRKGFSYSFTAAISKPIRNKIFISLAYTFGKSFALYEPVGTANTNTDQWAAEETVNGKNKATKSVSDFDPGHRINAAFTKKINYGKWSTLVTLFYNGQSGSPYSYVYTGSMINDNGQTSNFDLIYIPTQADLNNMTFINNTVNGITYTAKDQKQLLDIFINGDKYLSKHRGKFAERNGARLPFTHIIDLRIQQDFLIKTRKKPIQLGLIYDVFNFTNMLNKNWGRIYFLTNDNFQLIRFVGFSNTNSLTPEYQFTPFSGKPWSIQNSTAPGSSARWISQLGVKININ